jgi:hypothetical protein
MIATIVWIGFLYWLMTKKIISFNTFMWIAVWLPLIALAVQAVWGDKLLNSAQSADDTATNGSFSALPGA